MLFQISQMIFDFNSFLHNTLVNHLVFYLSYSAICACSGNNVQDFEIFWQRTCFTSTSASGFRSP